MSDQWQVILSGQTGRFVHIAPCLSERDHLGKDCWCKPTSHPDDPWIIVHHVAGLREETE